MVYKLQSIVEGSQGQGHEAEMYGGMLPAGLLPLFAQLFLHKSQAQLPRDVTALSGLGPPTSTHNRAHGHSPGQTGGGNPQLTFLLPRGVDS